LPKGSFALISAS
jgi:hypothetical protein